MTKSTLYVNAVLFDMDGVITNTMPYHYRAWRLAFRKADLKIQEIDVYIREGQRGITTAGEIAVQHGKRYSDQELQAILDYKENLFKSIVKTRFFPSVRLFIAKLKGKGIKCALVTGTSRHEIHKILPHETYSLFDAVISGNDVKSGKPSPEPYLKALEKLGIPAKESVVIENAPLGIQSALGAGLRCLAIRSYLPEKYLDGALTVFASVKEMKNIVDFQPLTMSPAYGKN